MNTPTAGHPPAITPTVQINLADYKHPRHPEWRYGRYRGLWTGGHPVVAQPASVEDNGELVPANVHIDKLALTRDELPQFIAWLAAVYRATDPNHTPEPNEGA